MFCIGLLSSLDPAATITYSPPLHYKKYGNFVTCSHQSRPLGTILCTSPALQTGLSDLFRPCHQLSHMLYIVKSSSFKKPTCCLRSHLMDDYFCKPRNFINSWCDCSKLLVNTSSRKASSLSEYEDRSLYILSWRAIKIAHVLLSMN